MPEPQQILKWRIVYCKWRTQGGKYLLIIELPVGHSYYNLTRNPVSCRSKQPAVYPQGSSSTSNRHSTGLVKLWEPVRALERDSKALNSATSWATTICEGIPQARPLSKSPLKFHQDLTSQCFRVSEVSHSPPVGSFKWIHCARHPDGKRRGLANLGRPKVPFPPTQTPSHQTRSWVKDTVSISYSKWKRKRVFFPKAFLLHSACQSWVCISNTVLSPWILWTWVPKRAVPGVGPHSITGKAELLQALCSFSKMWGFSKLLVFPSWPLT